MDRMIWTDAPRFKYSRIHHPTPDLDPTAIIDSTEPVSNQSNLGRQHIIQWRARYLLPPDRAQRRQQVPSGGAIAGRSPTLLGYAASALDAN